MIRFSCGLKLSNATSTVQNRFLFIIFNTRKSILVNSFQRMEFQKRQIVVLEIIFLTPENAQNRKKNLQKFYTSLKCQMVTSPIIGTCHHQS